MKPRRIIVSLTQEPDAKFYRVTAPLIGTVRLSIGEVVSRERVAEWCAESAITVRIVGLTPDEQIEQQLDLFSIEEPKRTRKPRALPAPKQPITLAK